MLTAWDALKGTLNGVLGSRSGIVRAKLVPCIGTDLIVRLWMLKPFMRSQMSSARRRSRRGKVLSFAGIPHVVLDSISFRSLPFRAKALLLDITYQYRGENNGDLTVAFGFMKRRGWSSKQTLSNAVQDLLQARLIIKTRDGRFLNPGARCDLYAITWQPINDCRGKDLDVKPTITPPRKFSLETSKTPRPEDGLGSSHKSGRKRLRDGRGRYISNQ